LIDRIKIFCEHSNRKRKLSAAELNKFVSSKSVSKRPCMNIIFLHLRNIMTMTRKEKEFNVRLIERSNKKRTSGISTKWFLFLMEAVHTGLLSFSIIWVVLMSSVSIAMQYTSYLRDSLSHPFKVHGLVCAACRAKSTSPLPSMATQAAAGIYELNICLENPSVQ
jgi:hypothetical protein